MLTRLSRMLCRYLRLMPPFVDELISDTLKSIGLPVLPGPVRGCRRRSGGGKQSTQGSWAAGAGASGCVDVRIVD